jgi:hypothetical protein
MTRSMIEPGPVTPLAHRREQAAAAMGLSVHSFDTYVRPTVPGVAIGALRVWSVPALQRWLQENERPPEDGS